ncbi:MAG: histidine phosphatase family protein [Brumimicrobium sp.]|nr:histidine phosphatase family protein [Brumimicrobium sp.]
MNLCLLRHGKKKSVSESGKDFDIALHPDGFDQAEKMSDFFRQHYDDRSFRVFCSEALRTKTTYNVVQKSLSVIDESYHNELYLANLQQLLHFIWKRKVDDPNVLVVGHNNGLSQLITYFTDQNIDLPSCGFVEIQFPEMDSLTELSRSGGELVNHYFPQPGK